MADVRRMHYVIFDLTCDANSTNLGPLIRISIELSEELGQRCREIFDTLRWDLSERLDFSGRACAEAKLSKCQSDICTSNITNDSNNFIVLDFSFRSGKALISIIALV